MSRNILARSHKREISCNWLKVRENVYLVKAARSAGNSSLLFLAQTTNIHWVMGSIDINKWTDINTSKSMSTILSAVWWCVRHFSANDFKPKTILSRTLIVFRYTSTPIWMMMLGSVSSLISVVKWWFNRTTQMPTLLNNQHAVNSSRSIYGECGLHCSV